MDDLIIEETKDTYYIPAVNFNATTGLLEISGESYLEDTQTFYEPVLAWMESFTQDTRIPVTLNVKLTYYNTSSSRSILEMLHILKEFEEKGGFVQVNWYCHEDDVDVEEEVEDFALDSGLTINVKKLEEEE